MTSTTTTNLFDYYDIEAFLGEYINDYDIDAIIDEATEIDYATGNRCWKDDIDLADICAHHDTSVAYDDRWNPSREACDVADEYVRQSYEEPIIAAGFRRAGNHPAIWFVQKATDDFRYWLGYLDTDYQDEYKACSCDELAERIGFDEIDEIAPYFTSPVEL